MNINDLRKVAEAATPGPWPHTKEMYRCEAPHFIDIEFPGFKTMLIKPADAEHVVTFNPALVLQLLAVVELTMQLIDDLDWYFTDPVERCSTVPHATAVEIKKTLAALETDRG